MATRPFLLIDADILIYKAAAAVEHVFCWGGDLCYPIAHLSEAKGLFEDKLHSLLNHFKTDKCILAISHDDNFRKMVYPLYKMNRADKPKPVALRELKNYVEQESGYNTYKRPWLEADDILGILATSRKIIDPDEDKIVVSEDKDLKGVPGKFFDMGKRKLSLIKEEQANKWHMLQTLMGDTADGYPGCPGVGPKKAEAALKDCTGYDEMWPAVLAQFEKAGLSKKEALTQARIARICRVKDYDFSKKEVKLWNP